MHHTGAKFEYLESHFSSMRVHIGHCDWSSAEYTLHFVQYQRLEFILSEFELAQWQTILEQKLAL
jgi:hypothetical protein